MSLSCGYCEGDGEWWYESPDDYRRLDTKRSRKCCSCKERINVGDLGAKFTRWRTPAPYSVEERIYGSERQLASFWMCERCADLWFSLDELGYCITLPDDMRKLAREAAAIARGEPVWTD